MGAMIRANPNGTTVQNYVEFVQSQSIQSSVCNWDCDWEAGLCAQKKI